jgi:cardiolipin synthase A/B
MVQSLGLTRFALAVAGTAVSIAVTGHVLLRKSDVRAGLGWIGVAWLSPIVGGPLYFLLAINRVTRRALNFGRPGQTARTTGGRERGPAVSQAIANLADIGQTLTGQPLMAGTKAVILRGGDDAYPVMQAAIREAQHSIALASYIFRDDAVGRPFIDALIDARRRGVAVRVLLDGVGSGYCRPSVLRRLRAGGVLTARFLHSWIPWRMPFLNKRSHRKLLIIDGTIGFTGGMNIWTLGSARFGGRRYAEDVHVRVEGPLVGQLMEVFAQDWSFTAGETLEEPVWWPALTRQGTVFARGVASGPDADIDTLETILGAALAQAQRRVRIVTPYFLPDQRLQFAITQARLRGVVVDIVTPKKTNFFFMDWAMRAHLRFMSGPEANVYLSAPPFDHSKIMTVDHQYSLFGSSNWDAGSLRLNFEFDVECFDADLTAQFDAIVDEKIARSRRLGRDDLLAAPVWVQLRDAGARLLLPYL